jgi:stage V sporulation protein AC
MKSKEEKKQLLKKHSPRSPVVKNCTLAFFFGGLICLLGEALLSLYVSLGIKTEDALSLVTASLILIAALLTAFGIYDSIARRAGAGTLLPVMGFSNSVVSEAMDSRSEGLILGVGAKIFTVAGPVILFGTLAGVVYGLIYYVVGLFL